MSLNAMTIPASPDVLRPAQDVEVGLQWPTVDERTAFNLRKSRGLSDQEIGDLMGGIRRETVCRLRARFEKKRAVLVRLCSGGDCSLLASLAG
jgi:DNA-directed RNA polymerase specialized sigma24 family protein